MVFVIDATFDISPVEMMQDGIYGIPLQIVFFVDEVKMLLDFLDTTNGYMYDYIQQGEKMSL